MARGWVYVLTNSSMPGLVKIGRTTRHPQERSLELSAATGVATPFELVFQLEFADCVRAEALVHEALDARHLRVARQREFFRLSPAEAALTILQLSSGSAGSQPTDRAAAAATLLARAEQHCGGGPEALQDIAEAVRLYILAASYGSLLALERLGCIFAHPLASQRASRRRAIAYWKDGAKGGNYYCYVELAGFFAAERQLPNFTKSWALFFRLRRLLPLAEVEIGPDRYGTALRRYIQQCLELRIEPAHRDELRADAESIVHAVVSTLDELRDAPELRQALESVLDWTYQNVLPSPPPARAPVRAARWIGSWLPQRRRGLGWTKESYPF